MGNTSTNGLCADTIAQAVQRQVTANPSFMTAFGYLLAFAELLSVAVNKITISRREPGAFRALAWAEVRFWSGGPCVGFGFRQSFELSMTGVLTDGDPTVTHAMLIQHPLIYGRGEQAGQPDYDPTPTLHVD